MTQTCELSFGLDFKDNKMTFDEILDLPQAISRDSGKKMVVCIDEFQNINEYDDPLAFQRKLRSHWQKHTDVCYCLYGSKRHMLLDIFHNYNMPFYKFGDILFLEKIPKEDWIEFIGRKFSETGKEISGELCGMITDWGKTYEAVMLLGKTTDTQDISGSVLSVSEVNADERKIIDVIISFVGGYEQVPPMYSALKHNGKKLYELARQGIEVERKSRHVDIGFIKINEMNLNDDEKTVTFTVACSKGTYIRTLIDDIGKKLGCGACMLSLKRTRVGQFEIDDSLTLNQISALLLKGELGEYIIAADDVFDYPKLSVDSEYNKLLYNGNKLPVDAVREIERTLTQQAEQKYRIYDENGIFIGIYEYIDSMLVPEKIFYSGEHDEM